MNCFPYKVLISWQLQNLLGVEDIEPKDLLGRRRLSAHVADVAYIREEYFNADSLVLFKEVSSDIIFNFWKQ